MRQVIVEAAGSPEQLKVETIARELRSRPGEFLIEIEAAGVNYLDVYQRLDTGMAYPLDAASDSHRAIEVRSTAGKLSLTL